MITHRYMASLNGGTTYKLDYDNACYSDAAVTKGYITLTESSQTEIQIKALKGVFIYIPYGSKITCRRLGETTTTKPKIAHSVYLNTNQAINITKLSSGYPNNAILVIPCLGKGPFLYCDTNSIVRFEKSYLIDKGLISSSGVVLQSFYGPFTVEANSSNADKAQSDSENFYLKGSTFTSTYLNSIPVKQDEYERYVVLLKNDNALKFYPKNNISVSNIYSFYGSKVSIDQAVTNKYVTRSNFNYNSLTNYPACTITARKKCYIWLSYSGYSHFCINNFKVGYGYEIKFLPMHPNQKLKIVSYGGNGSTLSTDIKVGLLS